MPFQAMHGQDGRQTINPHTPGRLDDPDSGVSDRTLIVSGHAEPQIVVPVVCVVPVPVRRPAVLWIIVPRTAATNESVPHPDALYFYFKKNRPAARVL